MWTVDYIISQICMALGMLLLGATYFMKINKNILICSIIYAILFCGHYLFLDAYMGVVINILGVVRGVLYYFTSKCSKNTQTIIMIIIVMLNAILGIITMCVWVDILPLVANILYCYALWQEEILHYRISAIVEGVLWIAYNIYLVSIVGILSQSILLVASIVGVIMYTFKTKREQIIESKSKQNKEININEDTI